MRKRLPSIRVVGVFVLLALAVPAGVRVAEGKADGKAVGPPAIAWKDMTFDQKRAYMKTAVVPTMKPIFQAFDAKKFKKVTCETCHGKDGPDRKFKMPSNDIHPLPNTPEAFQAMMAKSPDWARWTDFMVKSVEPTMGKLLGVAIYNPEKPDENAFACKNCHKLEAMKP